MPAVKRAWLTWVCWVCSACGPAASTSRPPPPPITATPPTPPPKGFGALAGGLLDELLRDSPSMGRNLGLHEYDGRIADYSAGAIADRVARAKANLARLRAVDVREIDADARLDHALLVRHLELQLFELEDRRAWQKSPQFYEELFGVDAYLVRDYAPLADRAKQLVAHEKAALAAVGNVRKNLVPPMSRPLLETSVKIYKGYAEYLTGDVKKQLAGVGDAAFQKDFAETNAALAAAAQALADWLEKDEVPRGDASHVLGRERFTQLLRVQEALPISIEELSEMGERNLAENRRAYEAAAARVKAERPAASALIGAAQGVVESSRAFVVEHEIVTIPTTDRAVVKETPPFMRWNSAFLNAPGPFDRATEAYYYVTLPDPTWPQQEQVDYVMSYGTLVSTSVHEVYPGHFLQGQWMRRAPTRIQKSLDAYSFVEGWAHYVEEMMTDEGFAKERADTRLGQLTDALLRNCRVVGAIGLHVRGQTVQQIAERFEKECHQDRQTAREQAVRGTFDPGYFAYTLGKMEFLQLRDEARKKLGQRFSLRAFHDAVLAHGAPPLPLIRERVLAELGG